MKVELVIRPNILEDIIEVLKQSGPLHHVMATATEVTTAGAFPHIYKIKISATCDKCQSEKIKIYIAQFVKQHTGVYRLIFC
jgi:hypothetical protein